MTSMDFEQKSDLNKVNAEMAKVSDLISTLNSAFLPKDFNKIEEILVSREKRMSESIGYWKSEYELMEKKHGEVMVGRLLVDEELSKCKRELGELADQVARLEEDKMLDHEKEILVAREKRMIEESGHWKREYELMKKKYGEEMMGRLLVAEEMGKCKRELSELADHVARLEEDKKLNFEKIKVSDEREKRARDMYKGLLEDLERVKRENRELMVKKTESDLARVKAERELESVQKKNGEFDLRITRLEGEVELLMSHRREQSKVEEKNSTTIKSAKEAPFGTKSDNSIEPVEKEKGNTCAGADSVDNRVNRFKAAGAKFVIHPCNEGISIGNQTVEEKRSSSQIDFRREKRRKTGTTDRNTKSAVVEISDSDDELPTQNQSCNVLDVTPNEEQTKNMISEQADGTNESNLGSTRNRSSFLNVAKRENVCNNGGFMGWSISSSDSDSDSDGDSCDTVAINRIITQGKASKA